MIWLSCRDLVTMLGVPKRTLLRWAKEDDWPTIGSHNHRRYDSEAAVKSYNRRRGSSR